jgi:hypothetical protein
MASSTLSGDIDGNEVIGAEVFGELHGVTLVGFHLVTGLGGNERGRDDVTTNVHLEETSCDPETASAGLVANVKIGELTVWAFGDASHGTLQGIAGWWQPIRNVAVRLRGHFRGWR